MYRIGVFLILFILQPILASAQTTYVKKVVLQAFWWDYKNNNYPYSWSNYLTELAPRLKTMGVDAVWIPPSYKNQSPTWVGYGPMDHYDLGDKFQKGAPNTATAMGTKDELLRMIAVFHANGIEVIEDVVLNHVDGSGSQTGAGGQDTEPTYSMVTNDGYKNFRYACYATPALDETQDDYWTRRGRWAKNYTNFHPNANNNCVNGDICSPFFGPDIDYSINSIGLSSNIPTSGTPMGYPIGRTYHNPTQSTDYMYNGATDWIKWYKKQTGVDGFRWDAVKHFPIYVQRDLTRQTKYNLGAFNGGYSMLNIGEWIGNKTEIDAYVTNMAAPSLSFGYEEHTGTFDFSLRCYGTSVGLYRMVTDNISNGFNLASLPGLQQAKRTYPYASPPAVVHRTVPFVNSHDTYRPKLDANGNFLSALGIESGWNIGSELGGDGKHIDPREPRMAAAYATCFAMDGNPIIFFEDVFDIGTTSKRWSHLPTNTTDLPLWNDIENISKCHQKLQFKEGAYKVRSSESGAFYPSGSTANDHLVVERSGKAVIGINDNYDIDQEMWIDSDFNAGTILMDYSGSHGLTQSVVQNDKRVYINTKRVGHTVSGAFGHGYSVWGPVPGNSPFTSVSNMLAHLNYAPPLAPETIQEWEMDSDLGDSHCQSLGQGGRTPDNSPNERVVGKIFAKSSSTVTFTVTLQTVGNSISIDFYDLNGNILHAANGSSATFTGSFTNSTTRWITAKIRNTTGNISGQRCYVKIAYTAPEVVATASFPSATTISIWTSNGGSTDWNDCRNWEEGKIPTCTGSVLIPHAVLFMPAVPDCFTGILTNYAGLTLKVKAVLQGPYVTMTGLMNDNLRASGLIPSASPYGTGESVGMAVLAVTGNNAIVDWVKIELRDPATPSTILQTRGALIQRDGDIVDVNGTSPLYFNGVATGNYYVAVHHRNHLGAMSATARTLDNMPHDLDFKTEPTYGTNAQTNISGINGLWAGNVNGDNFVRYNNAGNDRLPILTYVGSTTPLNTVSNVYRVEDVNMDGTVKYNGAQNDRLIILNNVGSTTPLAVITQQIP